MKLTTNTKLGLFMVVICLMVYFLAIPTIPEDVWAGRRTGLTSKFLPKAITLSMLILGALLAINEYIPLESRKAIAVRIEMTRHEKTRALVTMLIIASYVYLVYLFGFLFPTILALGMLIWYFGERNWAVIVLTSVGISCALFYFFGKIMMLLLPRGWIFSLLKKL